MLKKHKIVFFILAAGLICGATVGSLIALTHDLPQIRSLETFEPPAITRIYSSDKVLLGELFTERRQPVPLADIPEFLKRAVIATEDRRFYQHSGIDIFGIGRAIVHDAMAGRFVEGGSTITQQLAKTLFLTPERKLKRKLKEAFLALQLERRYTKNEILELYLNQIYLGSGAYGVAAAAEMFWGKSVRDLTLDECALIAAMPRAPSLYSPLVNPGLAEKRRNIVLKQMLETGIISKKQFEHAIDQPVTTASPRKRQPKAPFFFDYVKMIFEHRLGAAKLYKGGLSIYTTLSYQRHQVVRKAVNRHMAKYHNLKKQKKIIPETSPQYAVITLDVQTGAVISMVGGSHYRTDAMNRCTDIKLRAGAAFLPLIYACAIENGYEQNALVLDAPVIIQNAGIRGNQTADNDRAAYEGELTLRKALALSKYPPAIRLARNLGDEKIVSFSGQMGIKSTEQRFIKDPGSSETTLLELTAAYTTFADKGIYPQPHAVTKILDSEKRVIWKVRPQKKIVMRRPGAAIMRDMLQASVNKTAKKHQYETAGKSASSSTGNMNDLFIGFSPTICTGVWIGNDIRTFPLPETGKKGTDAQSLWLDIMSRLLENAPESRFDIPDGVITAFMNPSTGKTFHNPQPNTVPARFRSTSIQSFSN